MLLSDYLILPGVITSIDDPNKQGRIKCMISGIFDPLSPKNALPWIKPFCMNNYQNFSKPVVGAKVWVLKNTTNEDEYQYINVFEYNECTQELINEKYDNELEIIMSRKTLDDSAQIYYDNEDGIILKVNDNQIQIKPNGEIIAGDGKTLLKLSGGKIYIGSGEDDFERGVKGDSLNKYFNDLSDSFNQLKDACTTGSETPNLIGPIIKIITQLKDASSVLSKNLYVN